jgi:hypothetical protein
MEITTSSILPIYTETLYVHKLGADLPKPSGNFAKQILLFVSDKDENQESQTLLTNMLTACGVQAIDCYLFTIANQEQTLELINLHNPKIILSFGVYIANEVYKMRPAINLVQQIYNADAIIAMPLHTMINDAAAKAGLWAGLKQIFKIK